MSPEEKLNYVCSKLAEPNNHWISRFHYKMARLSEEQRARIQGLMSARKDAMSDCCELTDSAQRLQCSDNMREDRYERVCNGVESLCVWAELKGESSQSTEITDRCCTSTGTERVSCFNDAKQQYLSRFRHTTRDGEGPFRRRQRGGPQ
jgi:hypothetical protein